MAFMCSYANGWHRDTATLTSLGFDLPMMQLPISTGQWFRCPMLKSFGMMPDGSQDWFLGSVLQTRFNSRHLPQHYISEHELDSALRDVAITVTLKYARG